LRETELTMRLNERVSVPGHVLVRRFGDESVLLNLQQGRYFGLDEVGTRMWTLLTSGKSFDETYDILQSEYDVDPARLRQDLENLIERLKSNGLVEIISR
jgi:Coenzyme PQQ synthesis protein D (PqqD)